MARTRTRGQIFQTNNVQKAYGPSMNLLSSVGGVYSDTTKTESMTDSVSPGYFYKRKRGLFLPINSMTHTKYSKDISTSSLIRWKQSYTSYPYSTSGYFVHEGEAALAYMWNYTTAWPTWSGSVPSWPTESALVTEALANARSQGFDLLTFVAEWHKTVDLIRNFQSRTLLRAERVAQSLKPSRFKQRDWDSTNGNPELVKAFAETWLEGRYGWRILAYDIDAINGALQKLNSMRSGLVRGYATDTNSATRVVANHTTPQQIGLKRTPTSGANYVRGSGSVSQRLERKLRAGSILEAVVEDILSVDPLVTAWEVIPFSFILDWFANIGSIVEAYSPFATESLLASWVSKTETLETSSTFTPLSGLVSALNKTYTLETGSTCVASISSEVYDRYSVTASANLSFKLNVDALKLTDLYSIAVSRYVGSLRKVLKSNRL